MSHSILTPYPLIYCPVGQAKPECCPHVHAVELVPGKGPDAVTEIVAGQQQTKGGGGKCYGGPYVLGSPGWVQTRGGWWVQIQGRKPQDLIRLQPHPRVQRWLPLRGAQPDHIWQVPVLLEEGPQGWTSALDGVWDGERYTGGDLEPLQQQLLAVVNDAARGVETDAFIAAIRQLAIDLLRVGQFIDREGHLLAAGGFLSEVVVIGAIHAALGREVA